MKKGTLWYHLYCIEQLIDNLDTDYFFVLTLQAVAMRHRINS